MDFTAKKCPYCGSGKITGGVRVAQTAEVGHIGLSYKTRFFIVATEPFFADVCEDCGSVARLFVKTYGRQWVTK